MYWVWVNVIDSEKEAIIYGSPKALDQLRESGVRFDDGINIKVNVPSLLIERDEDSQGRLNDNVIAFGTTGLLFSSKLRGVLAASGVDNIEYFPVRIVNLLDGSNTDDYHLANIVGRIACVDLVASDVQMHQVFTDQIEFIDALVLDESRIFGTLYFRLLEHSQVVIVHEQVKISCEQAGVTGVRFVRPEYFSQ